MAKLGTHDLCALRNLAHFVLDPLRYAFEEDVQVIDGWTPENRGERCVVRYDGSDMPEFLKVLEETRAIVYGVEDRAFTVGIKSHNILEP